MLLLPGARNFGNLLIDYLRKVLGRKMEALGSLYSEDAIGVKHK